MLVMPGRYDGLIFWLRYEVKIYQHVCIEPGVNKHDFTEAARCYIIILLMAIDEFIADLSSSVREWVKTLSQMMFS